MSTASKYLLRTPADPADTEPPRLTERDALIRLTAATRGTACPMHDVGPVAAQLTGPIAALPAYGHPDHNDLTASGSRTPTHVNRLICDATGLPSDRSIRCPDDSANLEGFLMMRTISAGAVAAVQVNDDASQRKIEAAMNSGHVERLVFVLEPRLWCLLTLTDRARAASDGGALTELTADAAVLLAKTLTGPRRWDVRYGYTKHDWPKGYLPGYAFDEADSIMRMDFVHDAVVQRLVDGPRR